jgi:hypothetical protein
VVRLEDGTGLKFRESDGFAGEQSEEQSVSRAINDLHSRFLESLKAVIDSVEQMKLQ